MLILAHLLFFLSGAVTACVGAALLFYAHLTYGDLRETPVSTPIGLGLMVVGIGAMLCMGRIA